MAGEMIQIVQHLLLSSPPGEFEAVRSDVLALVPKELVSRPMLAGIARAYNTINLKMAAIPGGGRLLLTREAEVDPTHYYAARCRVPPEKKRKMRSRIGPRRPCVPCRSYHPRGRGGRGSLRAAAREPRGRARDCRGGAQSLRGVSLRKDGCHSRLSAGGRERALRRGEWRDDQPPKLLVRKLAF